jgi:hypothetical protein
LFFSVTLYYWNNSGDVWAAVPGMYNPVTLRNVT